MTAFVDVRFRGLRVAHKAKLIESEAGAFVEHEAPLPVGAPLTVIEEGKDPRSARVVHVVEHEAGSGPAGMRLAWDGAGANVGAPVPMVTPEPVPAPAPEPVAEPLLQPAANPLLEPTAAEPLSAADGSTDASSDASIDSSDDANGDRSSDGTVQAPVLNGNASGRKSKKNKRRR